jgi:cytochrome c peroxidase
MDPIEVPHFGSAPQVTGRSAQPYFGGSLWAPDLFWDGRATSEFRDPVTDEIMIPSGGGLESQSVGPIVSSVEMAKEGRAWDEVTSKLE